MRVTAGVLGACLSVSVLHATAADPSVQGSSNVLEQISKDPRLAPELERMFGTAQRNQPGYMQMVPIYAKQNPYPLAGLRDYPAPKIIKREPDAQHPTIERVYVESPAMRRVVQVQVQRAKNPQAAAPFLYLLDGVTAPQESGWLREGNVQNTLANEQVTVVMPTEALGSNYANWQADDPTLGRMQWETFLVDELPRVLEAPGAGLRFNGSRYIGGLSMGGSAAVRLANLHPDRFKGTFGLSGCYSSTSTTGREFMNFINTSTGGNPNNMWGPGVSAERQRVDVTAHATGLRNMRVYLYTSDGEITQRDKDLATTHVALIPTTGSVILEKMTNQCTHDLDAAMRSQGMTHQNVVYQRGGIHNWPYYAEQLPLAWKHISS